MQAELGKDAFCNVLALGPTFHLSQISSYLEPATPVSTLLTQTAHSVQIYEVAVYSSIFCY